MSDHTAALPEQPEPGRARKRGALVVVAAVLAVVLVAGSSFAAWQFFLGGGPRPAEVLPASTFALATVDLDPTGEEKIAAIKTLRKFPSWRKRTGPTTDSDLMGSVVSQVLKDGPCKSLDYESDVEPWIGSRAGVGGVLLKGDRPAPVLTLQIKDKGKARAGFARLVECAGAGDDIGWTLTDGYVIASDSTARARAIVAAGERSPLAADPNFQKWTEKAGGTGVLNLYVAPKAPAVALDLVGDFPTELPSATKSRALQDFGGAAAVLQFADGGIELSVASAADESVEDVPTVADQVKTLPEDTAAVVALAVPTDAIAGLEEDARQGAGMDFLGGLTGLDLPQDLQTLLGQSFSLSLGGRAPSDLESIEGPGDLPLGALVRGDPTDIESVVAKLQKRSDGSLGDLTTTPADDRVAVATTSTYADQLLAEGALQDDEGFQQTVRRVDDARALVYLDLDGDWAQRLAETLSQQDDKGTQELAGNLTVLRGLGASAWTEGDTSRALVRVSVK